LRQVLSTQWSSDLFLWSRETNGSSDPAVRPLKDRNSNAEASNVPHFVSQEQSLVCFRLAAAVLLATGESTGSAQGFGGKAPHLMPLGMLLPIGNRKVKTRSNAAFLR
jgi:hypothetical protein